MTLVTTLLTCFVVPHQGMNKYPVNATSQLGKDEFEEMAARQIDERYKECIAAGRARGEVEEDQRPKYINIITIRNELIAKFLAECKPTYAQCWVRMLVCMFVCVFVWIYDSYTR